MAHSHDDHFDPNLPLSPDDRANMAHAIARARSAVRGVGHPQAKALDRLLDEGHRFTAQLAPLRAVVDASAAVAALRQGCPAGTPQEHWAFESALAALGAAFEPELASRAVRNAALALQH